MILIVFFAAAAMLPQVLSTVSPAAATTRVYTKKYKWELDTKAMLSKSKFKIKPNRLIARCKEVVDKGVGVENADDLAEDFVFQFPVIGPLTKKQFLQSFKYFKVTDAFPDLNSGAHDFRVDPFQPNRVWFTARTIGTFTGNTPFFGKLSIFCSGM